MSSRANVNIMMRFRVIKLVGIFSLFVIAVFLYTLSEFVPGTSSCFTKLFQGRSTKENHLSTGNQIQLIQANEQLIIFPGGGAVSYTHLTLPTIYSV